MFRIYDCDFGVKVDGVNYDFEHVSELSIDDPERNRLTRGSNAKTKIGLSYKDGLKDPKKWTIPILNMSAALKEVLDSCYDNQTRLDVYRNHQSPIIMLPAWSVNGPRQSHSSTNLYGKNEQRKTCPRYRSCHA